MVRKTRRAVVQLVGMTGIVSLTGCTGLGGEGGTNDEEPTDSGSNLIDPPVDQFPFDDRLFFQTGGSRAPLSNPWFYKERLTDGAPVEGLDRPVWICVFADNTDYEETPPDDQPHRNFELTDGSVEPISGTEPTNDAYVMLKRHTDHATLKFVARTASASSQFYFDDDLLFDTSETEEGSTFELPP
jgi:hypothetical protein